MKKISVGILSVLMMLSAVFSTGVFAANEQTAAATAMGVQYKGHVQDYGNMPLPVGSWITGDGLFGTTGESKRIEGLNIELTGTIPAGATIQYKVHIQDQGDSAWITGPNFAGTTGESKRIEAIYIKLVGADGNALPGYSVTYMGHIENKGDTAWVSDGAICGTHGESLRIEAIRIKIVQTQTDLTAYNAALAAVNEADYTAESWTAYQAVVAANVVTTANTQAQVDAATAAIVAAQANLVVKPADLTAYNAALAAVTEANYTAESWAAYEAVVAANVVTAANTQAEVDAATAAITAAQANLVPSGPVMPAATTNFYKSLVPGMKIVLVKLDTTTPLDYTVTYDGIALTYDAAFEGFKADVPTTVVETLTPVVTKIEMPTATTNFYKSLVPGMKIVLVKLDTTTPTDYAVTYDGVALTYDSAFEGFKADVPTTVVETLTPVVTKI